MGGGDVFKVFIEYPMHARHDSCYGKNSEAMARLQRAHAQTGRQSAHDTRQHNGDGEAPPRTCTCWSLALATSGGGSPPIFCTALLFPIFQMRKARLSKVRLLIPDHGAHPRAANSSSRIHKYRPGGAWGRRPRLRLGRTQRKMRVMSDEQHKFWQN